jgi:hypothetical protein
VISDLERRNHRAARDLERLDDEGPERHRDGERDQDRFDVLANLALPPSSEAHVDLAIGANERVDERLFVERLAVHLRAERVEVFGELLTFARRELFVDRRCVVLQDRVRFVEERSRAFERAAERRGEVGPSRRIGVPLERQVVPRRPERELEEHERDMPIGTGCSATIDSRKPKSPSRS